MASLHKQPGKPNWFCAFTTPDGKRHFKSTGTQHRKQAAEICRAWAKASLHREKLNADKAREIIAAGVADVLAASGESLPSATVRDWCKRWLDIKEVENEPTSHTRYEQAIRVFLDFTGSAAGKNLESLTPDTILQFRDDCSRKVSAGTANTNLRIVRSCLNAAQQQGLLGSNPASRVKFLKERGESKRREMTVEEIRRVLKVCGDTPWRGLVLTGLYTGQRLGDCARLTWQQVDLVSKTVSFVTRKTGKRLSMRLAEPLADYLSALPGTDDPRAFVFPRFAEMGANVTAALSKAFAEEILIPAGLMLPRPKHHASTGKGRKAKRQVNEVTFHSLRHSLVTMLKATGASNALAQMIVGHDSAAVSARYTHLSAQDTADSISKLPDVTAPVDARKHR
jgi:integrase